MGTRFPDPLLLQMYAIVYISSKCFFKIVCKWLIISKINFQFIVVVGLSRHQSSVLIYY